MVRLTQADKSYTCEEVSALEAARLEPMLAPEALAAAKDEGLSFFHFPQEGHVDPVAACSSLAGGVSIALRVITVMMRSSAVFFSRLQSPSLLLRQQLTKIFRFFLKLLVIPLADYCASVQNQCLSKMYGKLRTLKHPYNPTIILEFQNILNEFFLGIRINCTHSFVDDK